MKKKYLVLLLCLVVLAATAIAQEMSEEDAKAAVSGYVSQIVGYAQWFIGVIAVVVVMVAGIMWMSSGGDPNKVENAKRFIIYAAIGMAVVLLAQAIKVFILPA